MNEVVNPEQHNIMTGLIGYTVGGVPYILDPTEEYHTSLLPELDANGERSIKKYFREDLPEFKEIISNYLRESSDRRSATRLERWSLDDTINGGQENDAPLPPGKGARVARK